MGVSTGVQGVISSGTVGGYLFEKSSKKSFGVTNGLITAMHLKVAKSSLPVTVIAADGVTMVQNSDEDHRTWLEQAASDWKVAIEEHEMYAGQREPSRKKRVAAGTKVARF